MPGALYHLFHLKEESFSHNPIHRCWSWIILKKEMEFHGRKGIKLRKPVSVAKLISKRTEGGERFGFWARLHHVCFLAIFCISNFEIARKADHSPRQHVPHCKKGVSTDNHHLLYLVVPQFLCSVCGSFQPETCIILSVWGLACSLVRQGSPSWHMRCGQLSPLTAQTGEISFPLIIHIYVLKHYFSC